MKKIKQIVLMILIVLISVLLLIYMAEANMKSPYVKALETLKSGKDTYNQILYQGKSSIYNGKEVILYGYIDKKQSRFYGNSDDINATWPGSLEYSSLMYLDIEDKKLLEISDCIGGNNLVELHGYFFTLDGINEKGKNYYITNIEKIYEFNIMPIDKGGQGERYECYSKLEG